MTSQSSAHVRRAAAISAAARALTCALTEHDVEQGEFGEAIGRTNKKVHRLCSKGDQDHTVNAADLKLAVETGGTVEAVALDLVRWQLGERYAVSPVPTHRLVADDLRHLAQVVEQTGELAAHIAAACADGHVSADEAERGVRLCNVAIDTIATARARFQHAFTERGDAVRRSTTPQPSPVAKG